MVNGTDAMVTQSQANVRETVDEIVARRKKHKEMMRQEQRSKRKEAGGRIINI